MDAAISPPPLPVAHMPAARADFVDWLSPMLVKELRQGVRTRMFMILFILLQLFMLLDLTLSLLVAANRQDASEGTIFFWLMVAVPTLLIVPLGGLNAIGGEIKGNTLELIFLTRLTAFRIVFGKWFALFSQSLLLVCAVLPYLVLRYFMGGVNLANELMLLGALLYGSALLTALATGISAFPARLVRVLAAVGGVFAFIFSAEFFFTVIVRGRMTSVLPGVVEVLVTLGFGAIFLLLMLDVGAARIAPPAENHPALMRLLACAALGLAVVAQFAWRKAMGVPSVAFVIAVAVCTVALCEQPRAIPSLYRPFARWGWPGRMVGRFFYPGWHTGALFTVAMFAAFFGLFVRARILDFDEAFGRFIALAGTLLLPVALIRTCLPRFGRPTLLFFLFQGACALVLVFCAVCDNALNTHLKDLVAFLPLCALVAPWSSSEWRDVHWILPVVIVTGLSAVALLIASVFAFRQTRAMERASLSLPTPPKPGTPGLTPLPPDQHAPLA